MKSKQSIITVCKYLKLDELLNVYLLPNWIKIYFSRYTRKQN